MNSADDLQEKLAQALTEIESLKQENSRLKTVLGDRAPEAESRIECPRKFGAVNNESSSEEKVALFRSLFAGRKDVYAKRWEGKNGRSGYSPVCTNEWDRILCRKPAVKCGQCEHRDLAPPTDKEIIDHLQGKETIGVYPLFADETCRWVAVDFDKTGWQAEIAAFRKSGRELGIDVAVERSRSGNGGHAWIFFNGPVPANIARDLGCALLTQVTARRPNIRLDSYDRLFPSQDTLPKGGFGNLIALPLQHQPRAQDNSVFLDDNLEPYRDQWRFLAGIQKVEAGQLAHLVKKVAGSEGVVGVRRAAVTETDEDPWTLPPSRTVPERPIAGPLPERVKVVFSNLLYFEKDALPAELLNCLIRIAAFQNPEFYRAQAMRLPTYGKPRVISCAQDFPRHIGLPRGCLAEIKELFMRHKIKLDLSDERFSGRPLSAEFLGELGARQREVADAVLAHDNGVLSAPTGFGKTVVAAAIIAARKTNTLILVHRGQLMDQWRERLNSFLDIPLEQIGRVGGGKKKPTGVIDIALIQSLCRKGEVKDMVADYGQIIVDECHHLPAVSFERVLIEAKPKYVLGMTATPIRKDGHHPIIIMQCGSIRHSIGAKEQAAERPFAHVVIPRETGFQLGREIENPAIQELYALLAKDVRRNDLIIDDIEQAVAAGRSPLVLTERTDHLAELESRLRQKIKNVISLKGGMGAKQRRAVGEQIAAVGNGEERVLVATGRYIGEGFDDARLDTLFLTMPISWRGTLQQYAGRLNRLYPNKHEIRVYDYVDSDIAVLARMYDKRVKGYRAIGYSIAAGSAL